MKKFLSTKMMIAGMMMLCAMMSFTACSSDDDEGDNGGYGPGNGPDPVETGWSGDTENGTSYFCPQQSAGQETGITVVCRFEAAGGVCTKADARFECGSREIADALYDYMINGDDDDADYAPANKQTRKMIKTMRSTRADRPMGIESALSKKGNTIVAQMYVIGKKMSDMKKLMDFYFTTDRIGFTYDPNLSNSEPGYYNVAKLPAKPMFGNMNESTLNYQCDITGASVYYFGGITKAEINVTRDAGNRVSKLIQTLTFRTERLAWEFVYGEDGDNDGDGFTLNGNKVTSVLDFHGGYDNDGASAQFMENCARQYIVMFDAMYNMPVGVSLMLSFAQ